jgi:hypothetical protein
MVALFLYINKIMSQYIYFNSNPILDPLTQNWEKIRDEFYAWLPGHIGDQGLSNNTSVGTKANHITTLQPVNDVVYTGIFKSMPMFIRDSVLDEREAATLFFKNNKPWPDFRNGGPKYFLKEDRVKLMPTMGNWLTDNFDILGSVQFNICLPGSKLNHHWGLDHNYLRLHLVLDAAPGCLFDIENEKHEWQNGELFGFDDSMVLHGTKHSGTKPRAIVVIDILKSAIQQYAKTWPIKPWQERKDRPTIVINWD